MQYYTRLEESPSLATIAMLKVNPTRTVEVISMPDHFGRTVAIRTIKTGPCEATDSVFVCAGDNAVFVASIIALAYAHNVAIDPNARHDFRDGI